MKKRKPRIIEDRKLRGEWVESVFMARAGEHGLPVSRPWGEMSSYDFVIGKTGRFVSVQVKSTISVLGTGYICTVRGGHKAYPAGSFDFLAVYVVLEDAWYIIPAKFTWGKRSITLYPKSPTTKYEKYREAWHVLREASEMGSSPEEPVSAEEEPVDEPVAAEKPVSQFSPLSAFGRMEAAMKQVRQRLEGGKLPLAKPRDEV